MASPSLSLREIHDLAVLRGKLIRAAAAEVALRRNDLTRLRNGPVAHVVGYAEAWTAYEAAGAELQTLLRGAEQPACFEVGR